MIIRGLDNSIYFFIASDSKDNYGLLANNVLKSYKQTDICITVHYKITYHHLTLKLTKYTEPFYQSHKKCKKNKCGAH